jgi:hypothetical protein
MSSHSLSSIACSGHYTPPIRELAESADKNAEDTALPTSDSTPTIRDRRKRLRFPLDTELRYQVADRGPGSAVTGTGQVVNISSRGLAFHADGPLKPGLRLNISMAWPASLGQCLLRMVFQGIVLRVRGNMVVTTIVRPEFRIAGKRTAAAGEESAVESVSTSATSTGTPETADQ